METILNRYCTVSFCPYGSGSETLPLVAARLWINVEHFFYRDLHIPAEGSLHWHAITKLVLNCYFFYWDRFLVLSCWLVITLTLCNNLCCTVIFYWKLSDFHYRIELSIWYFIVDMTVLTCRLTVSAVRWLWKQNF